MGITCNRFGKHDRVDEALEEECKQGFDFSSLCNPEQVLQETSPGFVRTAATRLWEVF